MSFLRISRPRFWFYTIGPVLIGLIAASFHFANWPFAVAALLYFSLPANLLIYGVNDMFDAETDALNPKKGTYEEKFDPKSQEKLLNLMFLLNAPFIALLPILGRGGLHWLAGFLVLGVFYSAKPIRAKAIPFLDGAFNLLYAAPGFYVYEVISGSFPRIELILGALAWTASMHAFSAIPDIVADRRAGLQTVATILKERGTLLYCLVLYLLSALMLSYFLPQIALLLALVYTAAIVLASRIGIFRVYRWFPIINMTSGAVLFIAILLERL
jgi:4-hydroxybenzoate polyprenyltransferase